jgi:hypothetical protein
MTGVRMLSIESSIVIQRPVSDVDAFLSDRPMSRAGTPAFAEHARAIDTVAMVLSSACCSARPASLVGPPQTTVSSG